MIHGPAQVLLHRSRMRIRARLTLGVVSAWSGAGFAFRVAPPARTHARLPYRGLAPVFALLVGYTAHDVAIRNTGNPPRPVIVSWPRGVCPLVGVDPAPMLGVDLVMSEVASYFLVDSSPWPHRNCIDLGLTPKSTACLHCYLLSLVVLGLRVIPRSSH
ncbi:hypothetical protein DFH06DRAFT_361084 [Mycena polygramma]|nr:hypothetical protein DFH06DRAFT_361084 [Mycena polygramma]